ncbi:ABC transporter permease [Chloroflexota bacterium]
MSLRRTAAILRKEILHIIRDYRNVFLVTLSPACLLFLLAYIFSFDVGQIRLAILDQDRSMVSRQYVASLSKDPDITLAHSASSQEEILTLLEGGDVDAGLVVPPGFANAVHAGRPAQVQAVVDGTDPFVGGQVLRSVEAHSGVFVSTTFSANAGSLQPPVTVRVQAWYNTGLKSLLSMVPGLLAVVLIMPTLAFALALVREKETGTLEGLVATPIRGLEYLTGKLLAYVLAGMASALLALLVAVLWFEVPFRGSLLLYLLLAGIYFVACMGAATVIANYVKSQQSIMFIVLLVFIVPSFFLAGLITPVGGGSLWATLPSYALPSTHFVELSRIVFLKGLGSNYVARPALILLGMGLGALVVGLWRFEKKVS